MPPIVDAAVPAYAAAAATDTSPIARVEKAGKVSSVTFIPDAAITGADTDTRKVSLVNTGQDGSGTTEIAALQFDSGVDAAKDDEKTITLTATTADRVVAAGDVLAWKSAKVGTGMDDPGGLVRIKIDRL